MGFRKLNAKKYNGVYEYFRNNDRDKKTVAFYIAYRDIDNKVKKIRCAAKNKDEALSILNEKKFQITLDKKEIRNDSTRLQQKVFNNSLSLDDVAMMFYAKKHNIEAKTNRNKYFNHISPVLGKKKISKINSNDILVLKEKIESKERTRNKIIIDNETKEKKSIEESVKLNPRTVKDIIENLRVIFNWSIKNGFINKNPIIVKEVITTDENETGRVLTDDELEKLWNLDELKMNDRLYLFLKTCYFTGARPAGVIDIQVKHINFIDKRIRIKAMKKGKSYEATANDELLSLLKSWIDKHNLAHNNYIFYPIQSYLRATSNAEKEACKNKSSNYSGYQRILRQIFDSHFNIGIDSYDSAYRVSVYTMRRTAGTKIYKKYGIVHAQKFLNHTDIRTTFKYLNIEDDTEVLIDAL